MTRMRVWTLALVAAVMLVLAPSARAANFYVDNVLGDVPAEERATITEPKPVQLLFQFTTSGAANARATNALKGQVTTLVGESGFYSAVGEGPAEGGAILSVTIDNIPQADAASRGFATGLTFGLRGTVVADYYEARVEYVSGPSATPIAKTALHTLYTTVGRTDPPPTGIRARNADEAVTTIVRQLVQRMLNDLAKDPAFSGAPTVAEAPVGESVVEVSAPATESAAPDAAADVPPAAP